MLLIIIYIYFNSRPHKEVDDCSQSSVHSGYISIHDLTRRSTIVPPLVLYARSFQFTTSQGGRPDLLFPEFNPELFQFTTSQGGRPCLGKEYAEPVLFQFTTSQGGRLMGSDEISDDCIFQFTTSQGGRLNESKEDRLVASISIHDLTRRSTGFGSAVGRSKSISIHDLTRRSTL